MAESNSVTPMFEDCLRTPLTGVAELIQECAHDELRLLFDVCSKQLAEKESQAVEIDRIPSRIDEIDPIDTNRVKNAGMIAQLRGFKDLLQWQIGRQQ